MSLSLRRSRHARSVAVFVFAALVGVGLRAAATPACLLVQALDLTVKSASIDASAHKVPSFDPGSFFFDATNNDPALDTFVVTAYDPDTDMSRTLTLRRKP